MPEAVPPPAGLYEPYRLWRGTGYLAAIVPGYEPEMLGSIGDVFSAEQGRRLAQLAAANALARIDQALNGFDRLEGLLHVAGHVASDPSFQDQPWVLDGASEVFVRALGDLGRHTRTAYAPRHLPRGICLELEITFAYHD